MNNVFYDPIVAEVRKNREELLDEFGGDTKKLTEYLKTKRSEMEAAGLRFETKEEREKRISQSRKRREEEAARMIAAI